MFGKTPSLQILTLKLCIIRYPNFAEKKPPRRTAINLSVLPVQAFTFTDSGTIKGTS